jgi:hypothetical protein
VAGASFLPSALVVCAVGLHILAVARGLYVSAPDVTVVHPAEGASLQDQLEISVLADDGPKGSGVRSVEYQLGSTSGTWKPLSLDASSMTYTARGELKQLAEGEHTLYVRATDHMGLKRTVFVTVKVAPAPAGSGGLRVSEPVKAKDLDFSWNEHSWAFDVEGAGSSPRG